MLGGRSPPEKIFGLLFPYNGLHRGGFLGPPIQQATVLVQGGGGTAGSTSQAPKTVTEGLGWQGQS